MTRIGIISQARMTSTRLPGKVLMSAGEETMLGHHVNRLRTVDAPIIIATTTNATDDPIVEAAEVLGVDVFRGSEEDVLSRFVGAAKTGELDAVVRVTSDCPLIDGAVVREGIDLYLALDDPYAYISNVVNRTYPRGFDFEVFSAQALVDADRNATDAAHREHVTPYINQNVSGRVHRHDITASVNASAYRVTLDTDDDLALIRALIEDYDAQRCTVTDIVKILDEHPELAALNAHIEQKKLGQ